MQEPPLLGKITKILIWPKKVLTWSKTTLNYQMMVERYPNLKEEVGGSNSGQKISSLLDGKLAKWSSVSCALALAYWPSVSKKEKKKGIDPSNNSNVQEILSLWHTHQTSRFD